MVNIIAKLPKDNYSYDQISGKECYLQNITLYQITDIMTMSKGLGFLRLAPTCAPSMCCEYLRTVRKRLVVDSIHSSNDPRLPTDTGGLSRLKYMKPCTVLHKNDATTSQRHKCVLETQMRRGDANASILLQKNELLNGVHGKSNHEHHDCVQ